MAKIPEGTEYSPCLTSLFFYGPTPIASHIYNYWIAEKQKQLTAQDNEN